MNARAAHKARPYRMRARAEASERTVERIHDAANALFRARPFEDVTLQAIADASGVTLQTILRRFGSKESLFTSVAESYHARIFQARAVDAKADVATIVATLVASYEEMGDLNWRGVVQEEGLPLLKRIFDAARAGHRGWIEKQFADALGEARGGERERRILLLFAATDFYVWKLYRRDLGLGRAAATARMVELVEALVRAFKAAR